MVERQKLATRHEFKTKEAEQEEKRVSKHEERRSKKKDDRGLIGLIRLETIGELNANMGLLEQLVS